jgi:hypothetical protein
VNQDGQLRKGSRDALGLKSLRSLMPLKSAEKMGREILRGRRVDPYRKGQMTACDTAITGQFAASTRGPMCIAFCENRIIAQNGVEAAGH